MSAFWTPLAVATVHLETVTPGVGELICPAQVNQSMTSSILSGSHRCSPGFIAGEAGESDKKSTSTLNATPVAWGPSDAYRSLQKSQRRLAAVSGNLDRPALKSFCPKAEPLDRFEAQALAVPANRIRPIWYSQMHDRCVQGKR